MLYKPLFLNPFSFIRCKDAVISFKEKYMLYPHLRRAIIKHRQSIYELYKQKLLDLYYRKRFIPEYISDEVFEETRERFAEYLMNYNAALMADHQQPVINCFPNEGVTHDI